jgi:hypothetical protein
MFKQLAMAYIIPLFYPFRNCAADPSSPAAARLLGLRVSNLAEAMGCPAVVFVV